MAKLPYFHKSIDFYVAYRVECIIDKKYKENLFIIGGLVGV